MTTHIRTVPAQAASPPAPTLAELIARSLSVAHLIDGHYVRLKATVDDGYIALDITRTEFHTTEDTTVRVLLHLSEPITTIPEAAETGVEIG
ncbi:MAG: hypothetical protein ACRDRP_12980 [Pseudonocardiaceae bacterium]